MHRHGLIHSLRCIVGFNVHDGLRLTNEVFSVELFPFDPKALQSCPDPALMVRQARTMLIKAQLQPGAIVSSFAIEAAKRQVSTLVFITNSAPHMVPAGLWCKTESCNRQGTICFLSEP